MYYGQIPPKSSLKLRFVIFKPEKLMTRQRFEIPAALDTFSENVKIWGFLKI